MLFAAGFGTRMKHLTQNRPKPLVKVAEKALIDYALDLVHPLEPETIVANLHYLPELLIEHLAGSGVQPIVEAPDILETGGGLRNALSVLGNDPVITMNTDAIWSGPNPLQEALEHWNPEIMDALLVCVPVNQTRGYLGDGDFEIAADGRLKRGVGAVFGGVQIIKTDRLAAVKERSFSLNIIWDQMLTDARLFGLPYSGQWCDVGHPEGIATAEKMIHV